MGFNRKDITSFLKKEGYYLNIERYNHIWCCDESSIDVILPIRGNEIISISFGFSSDGFYKIVNPTFEQVKSIISIFNIAKFKQNEYAINLNKTELSDVIDLLKQFTDNITKSDNYKIQHSDK